MRTPHPLRALAASTFFLTVTASTVAQDEWVRWLQSGGATNREYYGDTVAYVEDLDGDLLSDLLIGAFGADGAGLNRGKVVAMQADGTELFTYEGQSNGEQLGMSFASLGDLNGNGNTNFAVGAPYYSGGAGGFWAGRVYLMEYDRGVSQVGVVEVIEGTELGGLFGISLAAADLSDDGNMQLLVGASGASAATGSVFQYGWSGGALVLENLYSGVASSGEMFGFSLANAGDVDGNPGEEFIVGSPFADDGGNDAGLISVYTDGQWLMSTYMNEPNAHLGWSVAGNRDVNGDSWPDIVAGAPDSMYGTVVLYDGPTLAEIERVEGSEADEQFGYSVALLDDTNFDGRADFAAGAPFHMAMGAVRVYGLEASDILPYYDVLTGNQVGGGGGGLMMIFESTGSVDSRYGWSIAAAGDTNGTSREDLLVGAPYFTQGNKTNAGFVELWTPPDELLDGMEISYLGPLPQGETVDVEVINVKENADLRFYVGTNLNGSVQNGVELDIGGTVTEFATLSDVTGGSAMTVMDVSSGASVGSLLYIQVVEERNGFVRVSDTDSGVVESAFDLIMDGTWQVGGAVCLRTVNGNVNTFTYLYYSLIGPGMDQAPDASWTTGLENPFAWGVNPYDATGVGGQDPGDAKGATQTLPMEAANLTVYGQGFTWDSVIDNRRWSEVKSQVVAP